ncbi:SMI1/KNR4 family protein [Cryptosporangium aurantiacum]|uniref:SMI1/KNR4 family protein n=1 Tax=Cryptosporangium aurantiacum TaxID=134849 RepID=UPI000932A822|nr:SMI1/KNR4 family protein [Cryptosporangium aurantiacum]
MTDAWARIEDWMAAHAPASAAVLAPPADPDAIAAAEAALGLAFPNELTQSLRRHDGLTEWANVLPEARPLAVAGIVESYRERMDVAPDVDGFTPAGPENEPWWHPRWLPFGDAEGDLQVFDLRREPARLGWAPHDNPGTFADAWPSLTAYLTAVADALDAGGTVGAWSPFLRPDGTLWWDLTGATTLNDEPLEPAPPK